MKTGLLYGIVACSKTRVRCVFCGVYIPKASKCIEQHTNGSKHKENIELMNENGLSFSNDILCCKPCKKDLSEDECVTRHIESEDHANWMAAIDDLVDGEFISLGAYLSGESDEAYCGVCNASVNCSPQSIEQHVNHINHRTKITERLKPLNGIFPVAQDDEVWCKVCNIYIDNTVQSVLSHIDDDEQHMEWFTEIEDLIENQEVSIENYLSNEHETYAYCNKCQMEVLCTLENIESHVLSEAHLNQFGL